MSSSSEIKAIDKNEVFRITSGLNI